MKSKAKNELSSEAKQQFAKLREEWRIEDQAGLFLLTRAMECWDELRRAQEVLARDGEFVNDRFGQLRLHPATQRAKESRAHLYAAFKALSLDLESLEDDDATEA